MTSQGQIRNLGNVLCTFAALFFVFRTAIPIFKYPFIVLYVAIIILLVTSKRLRWKQIIHFAKYFYLVFILIALLILSYIISYKAYLIVFKDIFNTLTLISIFLFYYLFNQENQDLKNLYRIFIRLCIAFSILISLNLLLGSPLSITEANSEAYIDKNFALIGVFFGFSSILLILYKSKNAASLLFWNATLLLLSASILISFSARGVFLFSLVLITGSIMFIGSFVHTINHPIQVISKKMLPLMIVFITLAIVIVFFLFANYKTKYKIVNAFSVNNIVQVKESISRFVYSYYNNYELSKLNDLIWSHEYIPTDPGSGWGSRIHEKVWPLKGNNSEIVPGDAIGYLMDSSCNADTWRDNAYSYTKIFELSTNPDTRYRSSVYCYVSEDFNGDWVRINAEGELNQNISSYYDLKRKGEWQKLNIFYYGNNNDISIYLYFAKYNATDFDSLKGHVTFAYPENTIVSFDSQDPESGWGTRIHKVIYPLTGKNVDIVPRDAKGYRMDSTCNATTWRGNAYSYSKVAELAATKHDTIQFSSYVFVSEDFNGTWVSLRAEGEEFDRTTANYDLEKKGEWQKLELNHYCEEGIVKLYLYFAKYNTTDFDSLKGFVTYAYPTFRLTRNSINSDGSPNSISQEISYDDHNHHKNGTTLLTTHASLIQYFFLNKVFTVSQAMNDRDPIRYWISRMFSEDTTYVGYKTVIDIEIDSRSKIQGRTDRWIFAKEIFLKEYSFEQKILGGGFAFLNWYGYYFYNDRTRSDWPHNPLFSVLLYSGILGLALYVLLLYKVIRFYLRYLNEYPLFFIFFCITSFFSFFSSGSPFDPPVMGFFMMLPFLIDYVHKKERSKKEDEILIEDE